MMPMIVQEVMLSGNVEETRKLLNSEIVNANMFGLTLLHIASENGLSDMVELLIELGAEINAQESFSSLLTSASQSTPSFSKQTPLHMAAHVGSVDVTKVLLRHGADVNCLDQLLRTPLHVALEQGHIEVAEKLMSGGADVNAMSKHGKTPLHIAAKCGRLTVVHALIKAGAVVNVNIQGEYGSTPLHIATEFRHVDVVRVLLDEGANVDCRSQYGRTPLHIASECGKLEIVTALLRKGADVNCRDEYGRTPLHIACKRGQNYVIPVLLEHGADAMIRFNDLTQWSYGFPEIIDTLERHFIKVDAVRQATGGPDGEWTPHNGIWSQQRRNEFLRECLQELATLNQTIGETDFTYTDLLLRKVPAMRDLDVELCLLDGHVLQKFPIYGRMIDIRFQAGRRWRLLARAVALFYGVGDFAKLPSTLVAIICGYLRDRDLELITTFWKSTISFPGSVKS